MSRTLHRTTIRERDGYIVHRDPKPAPRRQATRRDVIRAELSRDVPAIRSALKGK